MMTQVYKRIVQSQVDAAFAMLEYCIRNCPAKKWNGTIGKYPFWQVAYHALYCADLYTATSEDNWKLHPKFHPAGIADVQEEYPSRVFSKRELLAYLNYCSKRMRSSLKRETELSLKGPAGFSWLKFTRAELPLYNLRHLQHHTGQLGAYLCRAKIKSRWVKSGIASTL